MKIHLGIMRVIAQMRNTSNRESWHLEQTNGMNPFVIFKLQRLEKP